MKYNDTIIVILITIFILLSIYYIGCVCDFTVTEKFSEKKAYVGDDSCLRTNMEQVIKSCTLGNNEPCTNKSTTYDALKYNEKERNYHTDYTCGNITGMTGSFGEYIIDDSRYKFDIRNKYLLLTYKCVKLSPKDLKEKHLDKQDINISSEYKQCTFTKHAPGSNNGFDNNDIIRAQIDNEIKDMIARSTIAYKSTGPIYACISQAPYLKGQKARFDIVQHGKGCYDNGMACGNTVLLTYDILLIFLQGDRTKIQKFTKIIADNSSRNALCFLNCGGIDDKDNLTLGCGCLNKEKSYNNADGSSYNSVCLAPDSDFGANAGSTVDKTANYSIVYFLNPYNNVNISIEKWEIPT
jgi:hypothetical protein